MRQAPESSKKKHIDLIGGFVGEVIRWHKELEIFGHLFLPNIGLSKVRMT